MQATLSPQLEELRARFGKRFAIDLDEVSVLSRAYCDLGETKVGLSGTFDMFHLGHARYFEQAKKLGQRLFVGVDSDAKVRAKKGPDRPLDSEADRLEVVLSCRFVDHVYLKQHDEPHWGFIKALHPNVLQATQGTYTAEEIRELEENYCGRVVVLPPQAATSTTARMRLLLLRHGKKVIEELDAAIASVNGELGRVRGVVARVLGGDGRG